MADGEDILDVRLTRTDEQTFWAVAYAPEDSRRINVIQFPSEESARCWSPFPGNSLPTKPVRKRVLRFTIAYDDLYPMSGNGRRPNDG